METYLCKKCAIMPYVIVIPGVKFAAQYHCPGCSFSSSITKQIDEGAEGIYAMLFSAKGSWNKEIHQNKNKPYNLLTTLKQKG